MTLDAELFERIDRLLSDRSRHDNAVQLTILRTSETTYHCAIMLWSKSIGAGSGDSPTAAFEEAMTNLEAKYARSA